MGPKRTFSQGIELTGLHILLELLVPSRSVVSHEPLSKVSQFFKRELLDLPFNGFYRAHKGTPRNLEQYTRGCLVTCLRC